MCAPIKLNFLFCKRKPLFDALSNMYQTKIWFVRCICCHSHCKDYRINGVSSLFFLNRILRFGKICLKDWKGFWATLMLWLDIQNSLDGFCNTPNVRNNNKTSRWFPLIRSATSCNRFLAVTEKCFWVPIRH